MRLWDRIRPWGRRAPDEEPSPEAVQAGGHDPAEPGLSPGESPGAPPSSAPRPTAPSPSPPPHPIAPAVVPRWVQMVLLPLAIVALWLLARAAGSILLVLIIAGMVALILAPVMRGLERRMPRG